jgi:uncharacterized damage-inducible protein DinB
MNAITESLVRILDRDLNKLEEEIKLFPAEESLWKISGSVKNSAGNLCLHLCGNLQHFIGAVLGGTPYQRNRDHEFAARSIPRSELIAEIQNTKIAVRTTLESLDVAALDREYPLEVLGYPMTTTYFLIHLAAHLGYHLGQVNYLRRLL